MTQPPKPIVLTILDGWGYREAREHNAILQANTPTWDRLWAQYPHALLACSGLAVGLPEGQMGNSEVGHLHMGAGRPVPQDLVRIDQAIANGSFFDNVILNEAIEQVQQRGSTLHLLGLLSPGGVHSHQHHIQALIDLAAQKHLTRIAVHAFLDGRDTPPRSALSSLTDIEQQLHTLQCGKLHSICGRYYAMDRDQRWDRIQKAYDMLTLCDTPYHAQTATEALEQAYQRNENDEFVEPTWIGEPCPVVEGDVIVFMNFRADRARQLTRAFIDPQFNGFERKKTPALAQFVSLTRYAEDLDTRIAFPPQRLDNVLGALIHSAGKTQLRIAETEKYAHVTFFFNGGREAPFPGEKRILVPSPKVATYDLAPEMSAFELTDQLVSAIRKQDVDVIICNYANPDMVGHTGNFDATVTAIETIDHCLDQISAALLEVGGELLVTADHGNAEMMYNEEAHHTHTAHTTNPVPLLYVGQRQAVLENGSLIDIAPTMCHLLGIEQPLEMTGKSLVRFQHD